MAPYRNSEVIPLSEVPTDDGTYSQLEYDNRSAAEPVVVVVDDEPLVADTLSAILKLAGYKVITAYCGLKALELVLNVRPALLISDVAMPKMNGIELALAVVEKSPDCGVVLFSGHATAQDLKPAREAGYNFTLLAKPVHPADMLKHVSRNLNKTHRSKVPTHHSPMFTPDLMAESA